MVQNNRTGLKKKKPMNKKGRAKHSEKGAFIQNFY